MKKLIILVAMLVGVVGCGNKSGGGGATSSQAPFCVSEDENYTAVSELPSWVSSSMPDPTTLLNKDTTLSVCQDGCSYFDNGVDGLKHCVQ